MNTTRAGIALVSIASLMWTGGCQHTLSKDKPQGRNGTPRFAGPQNPSMTHIWELRQQEQHRTTIEEVDRLVAEGAGPDIMGTALYVKADSLRQLGEHAQAEQLFAEVLTRYPNAAWEDPVAGGSIRVAPLCEVGRALAAERDSSPFPENSEAYTTLAWKYLNRGRFEMARTFAAACIDSFQEVAQRQQNAYRRIYGASSPKLSPTPPDNQETLQQFWALFDVGACHFITGQAFQREADLLADDAEQTARRRALYDLAIRQYDTIVNNYSGAWSYDPSGPWYWSVLKGANDNRNIITLILRKTAP